MRIRFDHGTLLFDDAPKGRLEELPGLLWDPRVQRFRAPAWRYPEMLSALTKRGLSFTESVRPRTPPVDYVTGDVSSCIARGDLDGDGDIDLAVGNAYSNDVSVFINSGDGAMLAEPNLPLSHPPLSREPIALQLHDLDGDRALDMLVATRDMLMVGLNPGDGHFDAAALYNVSQLSGPFAVADLDLDHDLDLAIAVPDGITGGVMDVVVLENAGDGTFTSLGGYQASLTVASSIVAADFDVDGWPDIAIGDSDSREFRVLLNRDDSVFETWPWDTYEVVDNVRSMVAADANGDGLSDLVLVGDTRIRVALNSGAGHFGLPQQDYAAGKLIDGIGVGDVAGDARPEIAVADVYGSSVQVLTNTCR